MEINNLSDEAKKLANTPVGKQVVGKVTDLAHGKLKEVRKMANEKGLGGVFDKTINLAEEKMGMDLDGDGDTGK